MKRSLVLGLLAALAVSSCQKAEPDFVTPVDNKPAVVFSATIEAMEDDVPAETKTSMDNKGNVLWKQGDQVSIFVGSTINEHYQITDESDGKTSAALNRVTNPGFVAGGEIDNNVAFYPYAANAAIAKRSGLYAISEIELPATQAYADASFGNGAFPMAAVTSSTSDYNLKFKNVLGGLNLQLNGNATIASIIVSGNSNEILCGAASVSVSNATTPALSLTDASATAVTLDCGDGVQLNPNTPTAFIIALPPMTMSGGFTAIVTDTDGASMEIKTTKSQTITRSNLLKMPAVNYVGTLPTPDPEPTYNYVDLGLPSGLKWATRNLGKDGFVSSSEEYGDYYAWAELAPYYSSRNPFTWVAGKTGYNWASYQWCQGTNTTLTRYNNKTANGDVDNKTVFSDYNYADDAAQSFDGGKWRTPTSAEWAELINNCTWTWTTQNGVNGCLVSSSNGNSIFLPAAGCWVSNNTTSTDTGTWGNYWSASLNTDDPRYSMRVGFSSSSAASVSRGWRYYGRSIRPVYDATIVPVASMRLNKTSLTIEAGNTETLTVITSPTNPTNKAVVWTSSNTGIATVDNNGTVRGMAAGTATITATTVNGGKTATCSVTVTPSSHAYVDLGLPSGLKWATCNLGATTPEGYGDYYAYGETDTYYSSQSPLTWKSGKSGGYWWTSYSWCTGASSYDPTMTKYNASDNKTVLDLTDDAARATWGGSWRTPTAAEWNELLNNCTWTRTTRNGVSGRLVTGTNGNSIFLPAAGTWYQTELKDAGTGGFYMSSSVYADAPIYAQYMYFDYISSTEYLFFSRVLSCN